VIVIERYDRLWRGDRCHRVHQEDICQSLAIHPDRKYQNDGGPGARDIAALLRDQSTETAIDLAAFADALIFNWLIAGTDAHAKNFSLLIAPGPQIRLAPLYDLASALPYPQRIDLQKAKLAMKIGGSYRLREIRRSHWESCARDLRMPANDIIGRAESMIERMAQAVPQVAGLLHTEGIDEPVVGRLVDALAAHSRVCLERLANSNE
ncbi:MAG: HipA domain-containing protein, partial [Akkermansiaceae bacterium]|nr:HipA domain-containing protein [Akkermansiaceae bacterium]